MRGEIENLIILLVLALLGGGLQALKAWFEKKQSPERRTSEGAQPHEGERTGTDADKEAKMRRFMEALGLPADEVLPPQPPSQPRTFTTEQPEREELRPQEPAPPLTPAPRQHPMGPGPSPWSTTSRAPATGEGSYEERMAARRRELERLKEARAAQKQARAPKPAPTSAPTPAAPAVPSEPERTVLSAEPLFIPLIPEASTALGADTPQRSFDVKRVGEHPARSSGKSPSETTREPLMSRLRDPSELRRAFVLKEILGRPKALEGV